MLRNKISAASLRQAPWPNPAAWGGLVLLMLLSLPLLASDDLDISADDFEARAGVFYYSGNVVLSHKEVTIYADRLTFTETADGEPEKGEFEGDPVRLEAKPEDGPETHGQAKRIFYRFADEYLLLEDKAQLKQGRQEMSAARIEYEIPIQRIRAQRGEDDESRVRTRFQQQDDNDER